jgi:hypothetical protein
MRNAGKVARYRIPDNMIYLGAVFDSIREYTVRSFDRAPVFTDSTGTGLSRGKQGLYLEFL